MRKLLGSLFLFSIFLVFPTLTLASPNIVITNIPTSVIAGQGFDITFNATELDINSIYKIKALGGDSFNQVDTWNSTWLQQNGAWSSMPEFTNGTESSVSATVKARFEAGTTTGSKDLKVRIRKVDQDPFYDSLIVSISVIAATPSSTPTPTSAPTQSPTSISTPTKTSSPIPTKSATAKPTISPTPTKEPEVMGVETTAPTETSQSNPLSDVTEKNNKKPILIPTILIGSGLAMIVFVALQLIRAKKNTPQT